MEVDGRREHGPRDVGVNTGMRGTQIAHALAKKLDGCAHSR